MMKQCLGCWKCHSQGHSPSGGTRTEISWLCPPSVTQANGHPVHSPPAFTGPTVWLTAPPDGSLLQLPPPRPCLWDMSQPPCPTPSPWMVPSVCRFKLELPSEALKLGSQFGLPHLCNPFPPSFSHQTLPHAWVSAQAFSYRKALP